MIINCDKCSTKFNLNKNLIPEKGRLLQCGKCENKWFFKIKQITDNKQLIGKNYTDILISQEESSENIIENNNHEIESDNTDEFITHKKKKRCHKKNIK